MLKILLCSFVSFVVDFCDGNGTLSSEANGK